MAPAAVCATAAGVLEGVQPSEIREMATRKYRVKGNIREWYDGAIVTEADLAKYPEMGGVARLRDEMGVLEDYIEGPPADPAPATQTVTKASDVEPATGEPRPNARAGSNARSGKS